MSLKLRQKKLLSADSPSLWNCTLAPGWSKEEVEVLTACIKKFGLGAWTKIMNSKSLPGKTPAQLNLQAQRLCGQQALGEFMGVHLDPNVLRGENNKKQGSEYKRKNGCLVNTGNNPSPEERRFKIEENKKKYGLTREEIESVVIPSVTPSETVVASTSQKIQLKQYRQTLNIMLARLEDIKKGKVSEFPESKAETSSASSSESSKDEEKKPKKKNQKRKPTKRKKHEYDIEDIDDPIEDTFILSDDDEFEAPKKRNNGTSSRTRRKAIEVEA